MCVRGSVRNEGESSGRRRRGQVVMGMGSRKDGGPSDKIWR